MIDSTDLMNAHEVEQLRRSVAMLSPGVHALSREQALQLIGALATLLAVDDQDRWLPDQSA